MYKVIPAALIERQRRFMHLSTAVFDVHSGSPSAITAHDYRMRTRATASIVGICCFLWARDA
jgi:hypothetical protein